MALGFKYTFFIAFLLMGIISVVWFILFPYLTKKARSEIMFDSTSTQNDRIELTENDKNQKFRNLFFSGFFYIIALFCVYAIISNFVKDGLTTWIPQILNEQYKLTNSLSIILTLVLPTFGLCGAILAVYINKYIKNHSDLLGVFFALSSITILVIQLLFKTNLWYLVLFFFGLLSLFMNGANNVITNMFPLHVGKKYNSGLLAGLLNGSCYVGSTLSQYLIALIAIAGDWSSVINVFFYICLSITALSGLLLFTRKIYKNNK